MLPMASTQRARQSARSSSTSEYVGKDTSCTHLLATFDVIPYRTSNLRYVLARAHDENTVLYFPPETFLGFWVHEFNSLSGIEPMNQSNQNLNCNSRHEILLRLFGVGRPTAGVRRLKLLTGLRRRACVCGLYERHAAPQETLFDRRRSA
jgi:hypothetical protein